jgi:DNA-binding transcriptional MerR regulator
MTTPQSSETGQRSVERLAYQTDETCQLLGGISRVSLWRLEKRGLITPSKALRMKLYSRAEIERFLETTK